MLEATVVVVLIVVLRRVRRPCAFGLSKFLRGQEVNPSGLVWLPGDLWRGGKSRE